MTASRPERLVAAAFAGKHETSLDLDQLFARRFAKAFQDRLSHLADLDRMFAMLRSICLSLVLVAALAGPEPCRSADNRTLLPVQEEVWALPLIHPTIAYVVRPVGPGPFPLAVMNHGVSLNAVERGFFPLVEFREAAIWFARRGYLVVAPTGPGYGAMALEAPELGLFPVFYSKIGACENPNFRDAGMAAALLDKWIID